MNIYFCLKLYLHAAVCNKWQNYFLKLDKSTSYLRKYTITRYHITIWHITMTILLFFLFFYICVYVLLHLCLT